MIIVKFKNAPTLIIPSAKLIEIDKINDRYFITINNLYTYNFKVDEIEKVEVIPC